MRKLWIVLLACVTLQLPAQDLAHYKRIVKELSSAKYQGRGYAKGGANKAGYYLEKEYRKAGVDEVTLQPFTIDINTFNRRESNEAVFSLIDTDCVKITVNIFLKQAIIILILQSMHEVI